jgi:hypothetical protein
LLAASRLESLPTDVVIHSSGEGPLELRGFPARASATASNQSLVEILDDGDQAAYQATRQRLETYQRQGMTLLSSASHLPRRL